MSKFLRVRGVRLQGALDVKGNVICLRQPTFPLTRLTVEKVNRQPHCGVLDPRGTKPWRERASTWMTPTARAGQETTAQECTIQAVLIDYKE
jgi:hypothetical protein